MRRQADDFDHPRQRLHEAPQRRQLFVGETARLFRGPARSVDGAADKGQRQRDIVRDALGAQFIDDRKALARGIVDAGPNLHPLLEHDFQRAGVEIRRLQDIEIDRAELDLGARLPDEIAPVDIGMQRADEDADTPERQARRHHPFAGFGHETAWAGRRISRRRSASRSASAVPRYSWRRHLPCNSVKRQDEHSCVSATSEQSGDAGVTRLRSCASFTI